MNVFAFTWALFGLEIDINPKLTDKNLTQLHGYKVKHLFHNKVLVIGTLYLGNIQTNVALVAKNFKATSPYDQSWMS